MANLSAKRQLALRKKRLAAVTSSLSGRTSKTTRVAAEAAAAAIADVPDVIAPFPGGIARSGSKVGSKYKGVPASTNEAYCPTLRGAVKTSLDADSRAQFLKSSSMG